MSNWVNEKLWLQSSIYSFPNLRIYPFCGLFIQSQSLPRVVGDEDDEEQDQGDVI